MPNQPQIFPPVSMLTQQQQVSTRHILKIFQSIVFQTGVKGKKRKKNYSEKTK